ncbi:helix-turn-helix transcriptional regulator [Flavisolibacter sp. BT320]|nr:helix-turn-helix transcriptional regulator [Flavisolibacter longurius]
MLKPSSLNLEETQNRFIFFAGYSAFNFCQAISAFHATDVASLFIWTVLPTQSAKTMAITHLFIRNMCCNRCIETVTSHLKSLGYKPITVGIGEAKLAKELSQSELEKIGKNFRESGFDLVSKPDDKLVVQVQGLLIKYLDELLMKGIKTKNLSTYLSEKMGRSYYHISHVFSATVRTTIDRFFMLLKMEKAKELLSQEELSLSEIAWQLGYSAQQTFGTQFKKETGQTPGDYRIGPKRGRMKRDSLLAQHFKQHS